MKVRFKFTVDDFIDSRKRLKQYSDYNKKVIITNIIFTVIGGGILFYFLFSDWVIRIISLLIAGFSVLLINPNPLAKALKKSYKKIYQSYEPIITEIEISSDGITYQQLDTKTTFNWTAVKKIEETEKAIYFYIIPEGVIAVPKRVFESNEEKVRLIESANMYLNKKTAVEKPPLQISD